MSMFEELEFDSRRSPREDIDRFTDNVAAIDERIKNESLIKPDFEARGLLVGVGNAVSYLLGRDVVASGQVLQRFDDDTAEDYGTGLMLPEGLPRIRVRGLYQGTRVLPVYMGETDSIINRVVHSFETSKEMQRNIFHDPRPMPRFENVCGIDALLFPAEPVDAHSNYEMENDILAEQYDEIMYAPITDEFGEVEKIKALAEVVDNLLRWKGHDYNRRNHRRISWLNAQGLLKGNTITAVNFILGSPRIGDSLQRIGYSDMSKETKILAGDFTVAEGYKRTSDTQTPIFESSKILYVRGSVDGQEVLVPARNILSIG